jgi:hypothetical protein
MLQCVINGPPNKRKCTVLVRCKPCHYSLPARDKSSESKGEEGGLTSCAQQSQVLQCGRDLRWANGLRAGKPCRLFPAHIFGSRTLGSRGPRHAKLGLARAFPAPIQFPCWNWLLAFGGLPPQDSALSTPGYLDNTHRPDHSSKS